MKNKENVEVTLPGQRSGLKRRAALLGLLAAVAMMMGCHGYPRHWGDRHHDGDHDGDHDGNHHGQLDSPSGRDSAEHVFYP